MTGVSSMLKAIPILCAMFLAACSTTPPKNINDSCEIFREKGGWYDDAKESFERQT